MKTRLAWLAGLLALFGLASAGVGAAYLRGLPRIEVAFRDLRLTGIEQPGLHDCLWIGPVSIDTVNLAFPDGGAVYWPAVFTAPMAEGEYLEISGLYPATRYFSFNTYRSGAAPHDHLSDQQIEPDAGAINPFVTGRTLAGQRYTIRVLPGSAPDEPPPNTLYFGPPGTVDAVPLIYRVYVPEVPGDPSGGAGLPDVTLVRADGTRLTDEALCAALDSARIDSDARAVQVPVIPLSIYQAMFGSREVRDSVLYAPGGTWNLFWSPRLSVLRTSAPRLARVMALGARLGLVSQSSGFYANADNAYVSTYINERFGAVVVLEGRLPRTPVRGADAAQGAAFDLRYWSLCTNEGLASTRYADCVHDGQVTLDAARRYTIAISKAENRPNNARSDCGVTWLDWGTEGDGAGHAHLGILILRNMLPNPDFAQAIQRIAYPGDERATMAEYLPEVRYESRATFERRGC